MNEKVVGYSPAIVDVQVALDRLIELKQEQMNIQMDLCSMIDRDENLCRAIAIGLVKPNFGCPPGFIRSLKDRFKK